MDAALAAALVDAQNAATTLQRDAKGDKGAYTSSDEIAKAARMCLNAHGLAWMRTGVEVRAAVLMHSMEDPDNPEGTGADIGMQCYAGDVFTTWILVHKDGGVMEGSSSMGIITSRGRPHDKAVAASTTYLSGQTLRGLLCWDRESKDAVDKRKEQEAKDARGGPRGTPHPSSRRPDRPPAPKDIGPRCSGPKGGHIGEANDRHVRAIHEDGGRPLGDVWTWGIKAAAIDFAKYDGGWPQTAQQLTIGDGMKLRDFFKSQLPREPGDDGDEQTPADPPGYPT